MLYNKLYGNDSFCRDQWFSFEQWKNLKQDKSVPLFEELVTWVKEDITKLTTLRSTIGIALAYFSEWESNSVCTCMMECCLWDTNLIENAIRPIALGQNNYLFAGSHDVAQYATIINYLVTTCKLCNLNAYEWLKVFNHWYAYIPFRQDQRTITA